MKLRRAIVVMMSGQGRSVPDITSLMQVSDDYVRDVIHAFNERGLRRWTQNGAGAVHERSVSRYVSRSDCQDGPG
ncbi:helix-turn-helix domain-containing protein [Streptosporangium sp. NPDC003464]